jgi:hypothetical protein
MSNNGAETIRRILDNRVTYYFVKVLVWAGYKILKDGVDQMKPFQLTTKGTTKRKLEKFANAHPEGFYLNYSTVIDDLLSGKVKRRIKLKSNKKAVR